MTGCGPDRECIHPPEEHRGAARIGRAKIAFFERDDVHSSPYLNMRMYFIVLRKGDLFLKLFHHLCNGPGLIPAQFSDLSVQLRRDR
jgi:hypothetical protein